MSELFPLSPLSEVSAMNRGRGERRVLTANVVRRRESDWALFYPEPMEACRRGRSRDRHPFDCGKTNCGTCHFRKRNGIPRPQDVRMRDAAIYECLCMQDGEAS